MYLNKKLLTEIFFALVIISIILYYIFGNSGYLILESPKRNEIIYDRYPEITWKGDSYLYTLILSNNKNFENQLVHAEINSSYYKIDKKLDFGAYYLKIIDEKDNYEKISYFEIRSLVAVENVNGSLRNAGNTKLTAKSNFLATGAAILDINMDLNKNLVGENWTFEQNE